MDEPRRHRGALALLDTATGERRSVDPEGQYLPIRPFPRTAARWSTCRRRWETGTTPRGGCSSTWTSAPARPGRCCPLTRVCGRPPGLLPRRRRPLYFIADEAGPRAGLPARPRHRRGHPADRLRGVHRPRRQPGRPRRLRAALRRRLAAGAGPARPRPGRTRSPSPCSDRRPTSPFPARSRRSGPGAEDGTPLRAWLALPPAGAADCPAPLLLWIHGGPLSSWNAWSWRWNPWLWPPAGTRCCCRTRPCPPATAYDFLQRGWGAWGGRAVHRPDGDHRRGHRAAGHRRGPAPPRWAARSAATWPTGSPTQTDRFRAIVTHASLWHLDAFAGTTDEPSFWHREFGDPLQKQERYLENSPHLRAESIRTPMLVIHGDKDYRVPIGEALRLWNDLDASRCRRSSSTSRTRTTGSSPRAREGLVRDRRGLPRRARPRRALAPPRPALIRRRLRPLTSG